MGGMVLGGLLDERAQFNEHMLCSGEYTTGGMGNYAPLGDLLMTLPHTHPDAAWYDRELSFVESNEGFSVDEFICVVAKASGLRCLRQRWRWWVRERRP